MRETRRPDHHYVTWLRWRFALYNAALAHARAMHVLVIEALQ